MLRSVIWISRLLTMGGVDLLVFVAACLLGLTVQVYLPNEPWSTGIGVLVAYHLFLAWLLISSDQGVPLGKNTFSTITTHLACMAVAYSCAWSAQEVGNYAFFALIPGFRFLGFFITLLAFHEQRWLLTGQTKSAQPEQPAAPAPDMTLTGEDYEEFLRYLATRNPMSVPPGTSVTTEYTQWRRARARSRGSLASAR